MGYVFRPAPGWPTPPVGWVPPQDWKPDPAWPPAPADWDFWAYIEDQPGASSGGLPTPSPTQGVGSGGVLALIGVLVSVVALVIGYLAWTNPDPENAPSDDRERAAYLRQVDALCTDAGEKLQAVAGDDYATASQIADDLLQSWASLDFPTRADERLLRPILDALESLVISFQEIQGWVNSGDVNRAEDEFQRARGHIDDFRKSSREYGLVVCPNIFTIGQ